jgi:hypothetical protein
MMSEHPTQLAVAQNVQACFEKWECAETERIGVSDRGCGRWAPSELAADTQRLTARPPLWLRLHRLELTASNMAGSLAQLSKEIDHEQEQGDE